MQDSGGTSGIENPRASASYWDTYYSQRKAPIIPSQFAVFVAGQFESIGNVIDIGCGNGRDALFFASIGKRVLAIDRSQVAIEHLKQSSQYGALTAIAGEVGHPGTLSAAIDWLRSSPGDISGLLYARFFLHAIADDQEDDLLRFAKALADLGEIPFCLEFRTKLDAELSKVTAHHFRRFVDPADFFARAARFDLKPHYLVEGFGYAKMQQDDAHVARIILTSDRC